MPRMGIGPAADATVRLFLLLSALSLATSAPALSRMPSGRRAGPGARARGAPGLSMRRLGAEGNNVTEGGNVTSYIETPAPFSPGPEPEADYVEISVSLPYSKVAFFALAPPARVAWPRFCCTAMLILFRSAGRVRHRFAAQVSPRHRGCGWGLGGQSPCHVDRRALGASHARGRHSHKPADQRE